MEPKKSLTRAAKLVIEVGVLPPVVIPAVAKLVEDETSTVPSPRTISKSCTPAAPPVGLLVDDSMEDVGSTSLNPTL